MLEKLLIIIIIIITIFIPPSKAWAEINQANLLVETISIEKNSFIYADSPSFELIRKDGNLSTEQVNSNLWLASIFVTGLGQIMMGNTFTGITFFLSQALLVTSLIFTIKTNSGGGWIEFSGWFSSVFITPFVLLFLGILIIYLHIWSIIDAYNKANEIIPSKINSNKNTENEVIFSNLNFKFSHNNFSSIEENKNTFKNDNLFNIALFSKIF